MGVAPPPGSDVDVVIAGCGPVGATLAVLLAQLGRSVVVLERQPRRYPLPRAVHFDQHAGRILQACGLGGELEAVTEPADVYEWRNAEGRTLLRIGRAGVGSCGWPHSSMFHQPALEAVLHRRVGALADRIDVRRGAAVHSLRPEGDGVRVGYTERAHPGETGGRAGGPHATVRGRYVIGCDGAQSTVRHLLGVPVHDLGFSHDWLTVDVVLHQPRVFDPVNLQICDPARPVTAVSGGPGRRRWEFMRLPGESPTVLEDEATAWRLLEPFDVRPSNATLERHALYTFHARWVGRWRAGRVLLAGDAAHQMPPFAGQGLCAGLVDAHNLAWKLDHVLTGRAGERLLDTYQQERGPQVAGQVELSVELGRVICVPDPAAAAARDEAMLSAAAAQGTIAPPEPAGLPEGLRAGDTAAAGQLFPQGLVDVEGRRRRFDDAVGPGWRLVTRTDRDRPRAAGPPPDGELAAWFEGIGGRHVTVGTGGDLEDTHGGYGAWFAGYGVTTALQRPDFHVYGTARNPAATAELLRSLRARLAF